MDFQYTSGFAEALNRTRTSLLLSTYQSNRILIVSLGIDGRVAITSRTLIKPMGISYRSKALAVASKYSLWLFSEQDCMTDEEGRALPYSSVFTPRISYVTGDILCHQVTITEREPVMVNTRFSCLASPSAQYSFVPLWKPSFISELVPEDRCHLNGVACDEHGSPCYVTALGESNSREGWRQHAADGGVVWSVARQEAIVRGLAMPHSPCVHEGKLWLLESLSGVLVYVTPEIGAKTEVSHVGAFARGLSFAGPYAFVGLSLGRESAVAIPANSQRECGVVCIDYSRGTSLGSLTFQSEIGEIFDVCALPAHPLPYLIGFEDDMILGAFTLPSPAVFKGGLSGQ